MSNHTPPNTPVPAEFVTAALSPDATPRQMEWILKCRDEKALDEAQIAWLDAEIDKGISKGRASEILDRLFKLPSKPVTPATTIKNIVADNNPFAAAKAADLPTIADGRYALRDDPETLEQDDPNPIKFYRVNTPTEGKWANFTFVKRYSSDAEYPVKGAARLAVLARIADDPTGASQLYGREIGCCGRCARTLTRRLSREFGIGPDCAEQMGISQEMLELKSKLIAEGIDPEERVA